MVRIRLRRVGARRQPYYRIVVADQRSPGTGRFIEEIGHYNPRTEPETVVYKKERAVYWLSQGAQPSDSVNLFLKRDGIYEALKAHQQGTPIAELFAGEEDTETEAEAAPESAAEVPSESEVETTAEAESVADVEVTAEDADAEADDAEDAERDEEAADEDVVAEEEETEADTDTEESA